MVEQSIARSPFIDLAAWQASETEPAVMIINGHDIKMRVRGGQLHVIDGPPGQPRTRTIARVPRTVERVLILSGHGMRSIEAERWLAWAKIPWAVLDTETGQFLSVSGPEPADARLLRAQSRACEGGELESTGLEITRYLLTEKIRGQLANVAEFFTLPDTETYIKARLTDAESAVTFEALNSAEGKAASAYWQAWSGRVHVPFSPTDLQKVPSHWWAFTQRPTLAGDYVRNKNGTDPVNSCLNYLFRVAESECVNALHAVGLSPVLGVNHADRDGRDSLALDLIEAARPLAERIVLQLMAPDGLLPTSQATGKPLYFDRRWVTETREGIVRLVPPLTHQLASHAAGIGAAVRPHAFTIARMLADAADGKITVRRPKNLPRQQRLAIDHRDYPKNRLRRGVTAADIVPDELWDTISPLIPAEPVKRGRPPTPSRDLVTALIARFVLSVPWTQVPGGVEPATVRRWQSKWTADGTWPKVRQLAEAHGHLSALTV